VIHGEVSVNGEKLSTGDAVAVDSEEVLKIAAQGTPKSEILLFDLQ
jgi:redox-sensitive bicupin YhaK (pirin superfamily)